MAADQNAYQNSVTQPDGAEFSIDDWNEDKLREQFLQQQNKRYNTDITNNLNPPTNRIDDKDKPIRSDEAELNRSVESQPHIEHKWPLAEDREVWQKQLAKEVTEIPLSTKDKKQKVEQTLPGAGKSFSSFSGIAKRLNFDYTILSAKKISVSHPSALFLHLACAHLCSIGLRSGE
ncbi:hypothetical protein [Arsenophonus endosymbiont of Bemisia tabaci]|uniref:hypothetical protein n=1 Tax=Arsenophonus endosymbiont of Bemisia tabaci TaxID=536059 RepID=UPI0015F657A3|nr:hypothetical protein [Arsenophonus endosymbiont of Bemisia tabaci]CAA2930732.1 hypothetical protein ARSQ2_01868 [Arsenophonus endosymbiont of Bemisia tabaci Q2]